MLNRLFIFCENLNVSVVGCIATIFSIALIRTFLETISTRTAGSVITSDYPTIIHYILFYIPVILAIAIIILVFSGRPAVKVISVTTAIFPVILLPPLIDLVLTRGAGGQEIAYLFVESARLVENYFTFFNTHDLPGITRGIRVELAIILVLTFIYVLWSTKNLLKALLASIATYSTLFVFLSLPSIVAIGHAYPFRYLTEVLYGSLLEANYLHPAIYFERSRYFAMYFNGAMSLILYTLTIPLVAIFFYLLDKQKFLALIKNSRLERVAYYFVLIALGMFIAVVITKTAITNLSWLDVLTLMTLFFSFYFAWMFAVGTNDIVDQKSDALSNKGRPLITGVLSVGDIRASNVICFLLLVVGGFLVGHHALFYVLIFTALYYIYSSPPLQLKRFAFVNASIIALCALTAVFAGYFTVSPGGEINSFPMNWLILIFSFFFLIANVKDIKDIEGDKAVGVYTIPVLLGAWWGRRIIALMSIIALVLVPILTEFTDLKYLVLPYGLVSYYLLIRNPFIEKWLFFLLFSYLFIAGVMIIS